MYKYVSKQHQGENQKSNRKTRKLHKQQNNKQILQLGLIGYIKQVVHNK